MALKCGIVGLTNIGKTTIFNCFSENKAEVTNFSFSTDKSNLGTIKVPDTRLNILAEKQPTQKIIKTVVDIVDIPGIAKGAGEGEGIGNKFLGDLRGTDALIHVLRCFEDENLPHPEGSIDPVRDMEVLNFELQVKDLESVEKKIQRLEKLAKSNDKEAKRGLEVLSMFKDCLENFKPASSAAVKEEDFKYIKDLNLLTVKPIMYVCNVDEASAVNGNKYTKAVQEALKNETTSILIIAAKMEAEISELELEEERREFLSDMGLDEPGVNKLIRAAYDLLNLQTFFTVGPKEIHAWTLKKGMTAPQAAGVIHSDLEKGFIRAEVMHYDDFVNLGSEQKCKEAGKFYVEGKNYPMQDGDIINVRFNV
ncbi:MAG: redox-regulated ATPase YchF [Bacteroidia bacterium]|nr:MAG: redox-regulated ATPase YchF [Bacteroidia bacterium]